MAIGTSRAFPIPNPAWPWLSPTSTSAEKLRFLPPLTTLVTRLMAMTSSLRSDGFTSRSLRTARLSRKSCFDIGLELKPRSPRRTRARFAAAVILVTAAIKNLFVDSSRFGALGDELANHFGRRHVAAAFDALFGLGVHGAGGDQRLAGMIVNHLRINVIERAVHREARALRRTGDAHAQPGMHLDAMLIAR